MTKYIMVGNIKIKFKTVTKFSERIKSFRFYLKPISEGLCYPKKKMINTYFICQKLDIVVTDKKNTVLAIYNSFGTEKFIRPRIKAYYIYLLPEGSAKGIKKYDKLKIIGKEK